MTRAILLLASLFALTGCAGRTSPLPYARAGVEIERQVAVAVLKAQVCVEIVSGREINVDLPTVFLRRGDVLVDGLWRYRTETGDLWGGDTNKDRIVLACDPKTGAVDPGTVAHEALHWVLIHGLGLWGHETGFGETCIGGW